MQSPSRSPSVASPWLLNSQVIAEDTMENSSGILGYIFFTEIDLILRIFVKRGSLTLGAQSSNPLWAATILVNVEEAWNQGRDFLTSLPTKSPHCPPYFSYPGALSPTELTLSAHSGLRRSGVRHFQFVPFILLFYYAFGHSSRYHATMQCVR